MTRLLLTIASLIVIIGAAQAGTITGKGEGLGRLRVCHPEQNFSRPGKAPGNGPKEFGV